MYGQQLTLRLVKDRLLQDIGSADPRAKAQLDLLSHLIGSQDSSKGAQMEFHLSLFSDNADDDEENAGYV